ncbi:polyprenol monophosphomannose synthase [Halegenticoccus tardaugens]|uniref:polyprenol monophosphomannose synthase n=1 Tax=Halegenticoccus tardaugens TaxID=2071624 RepID=UPI00100B0406|nr:polyprenol monophosphomannose synthase [Halegenticoccus tardaugens]
MSGEGISGGEPPVEVTAGEIAAISGGERVGVGPQTVRPAAISIIIPTYNESQNILHVIDRCRTALDGDDFEIIVVDDDSPDGTWKLVEDRYAEHPRVHVIRRIGDRGLAAAVSRGFREAACEYCAVMDADLQHPPEKLPELVEALRPGVDVVIGSRHVEGGGIEDWSVLRRLVSRGATFIARLAIPEVRSISDPMSGFFAIRRDVVTDVDLQPTGYKILLEILTKGEYGRVVEVPYVFKQRERGTSKLTAFEYVHFLEHLLRLRRHSRRPPLAPP